MAEEVSKQDITEAAIASARQLGYEGLKELQVEVIVGVLTGRDVFAVLPTGYGKSLCYGCLPGVFEILYRPLFQSIVCVVTPLTAIIKDQVRFVASSRSCVWLP